MAQTKRLPDAELEVMQTIWTLTPPVTAAEVQQHASSDWKMTSVLLYTPLVSEEDYRQRESVGFIRRLCGGSVKNLVASLSDAGALSDQDIDELRAFLDAQEQ